jgi:hypothetical protein
VTQSNTEASPFAEITLQGELRGARIHCMVHLQQASGMCLQGSSASVCVRCEKGKPVVRRGRKAKGLFQRGRRPGYRKGHQHAIGVIL